MDVDPGTLRKKFSHHRNLFTKPLASEKHAPAPTLDENVKGPARGGRSRVLQEERRGKHSQTTA